MSTNVASPSSANTSSRLIEDRSPRLLDWIVDYFPLVLLGQALGLLVINRSVPQLNGMPSWVAILFLLSTLGVAIPAIHNQLAKRLNNDPARTQPLTMFLMRLLSSLLMAVASVVALFYVRRIIESNSSLALGYLLSMLVYSLLCGFLLFLFWVAFVRPGRDDED